MTKRVIVFGAAVIGLSTLLFFTACKKKETKTEAPVETPDIQSGADSRDAQSENDAAMEDINNVIGNSRLAGKSAESAGAAGVTGDICGLTVDSVDVVNGVITFSYTGVTCFNRTRTGVIKLTLQGLNKWKNVGSIIKVEYKNYKVVRASDKKSVTLNGIQFLTNVSGGTWWDLVILKTKTNLVSTVTGTNLNVTFEDNKTAVYNMNRRITYTYPGNIVTVKAEGIGSSAGINDLENFGTGRNGEVFTSQVTTPIVWNVTCGGAVIQGAVNIKVSSKAFDLKFTYGVDVSGNPVVVGANNCPYGWKLEWTVNGSSNSKIFGYN
jgi:hypothetical protein